MYAMYHDTKQGRASFMWMDITWWYYIKLETDENGVVSESKLEPEDRSSVIIIWLQIFYMQY